MYICFAITNFVQTAHFKDYYPENWIAIKCQIPILLERLVQYYYVSLWVVEPSNTVQFQILHNWIARFHVIS